jgi:hypothetical protein
MGDVEDEVVDAGEEEVEDVEEIEEEEEEELVAAGATEVKLFGKWSFDDIEIRDISLEVSAASRFAWKCVSQYVLAATLSMLSCVLSSGLHRLQRRPCCVSSPHCRTVPTEEIPKGFVPYRGAPCLLLNA